MGHEENLFELIRDLVKDEREQEYPDEIGEIEKHREEYDNFVENLFKRGYTHVAYGEVHSREILHFSVVKLVTRLKASGGLDYVCLEIERENQEDINSFMKTGDDGFLERIRAREKEMLRRNYPVEGRVNGSYFKIIEEARNSNIEVIAMDSHKKRNRNKFMAEKIPKEGRVLIYVGQGHLMRESIPKYFINRTGIEIYSIWQVFLGEDGKDELAVWLDSLAKKSDALSQKPGFALNLKNENLRQIASRHSTLSLIDPSLGIANSYSGILCHR